MIEVYLLKGSMRIAVTVATIAAAVAAVVEDFGASDKLVTAYLRLQRTSVAS